VPRVFGQGVPRISRPPVLPRWQGWFYGRTW